MQAAIATIAARQSRAALQAWALPCWFQRLGGDDTSTCSHVHGFIGPQVDRWTGG
jgi:hypothetical protein